jgi:hypothetical protein
VFVSFFPRPRLFLVSVIIWTLMAVALWFLGAKDWGGFIGLPQPSVNQAPIVGVSIFWSPAFLWFYVYYLATGGGAHRTVCGTVETVARPHTSLTGGASRSDLGRLYVCADVLGVLFALRDFRRRHACQHVIPHIFRRAVAMERRILVPAVGHGRITGHAQTQRVDMADEPLRLAVAGYRHLVQSGLRLAAVLQGLGSAQIKLI